MLHYYKNWRLILNVIILFSCYFFTIDTILTIEKNEAVKRKETNQSLLFDFVANLLEKRKPDQTSALDLREDQLNHHHIKLSLNRIPLTENIFTYSDINVLHNYLQSQHVQKLSYRLNNGLWLNYDNEINKHILGRLFIFFLISILCVGLALTYGWTVLRFTIPISRLKKSVKQLGVDINSKLNQGPGPVSLMDTEDSLQKMQNRIKDLIDSRTKLLASISHDLRTPLTRAKLKAYFLEDPILSERITNDLNEMENMINATLTFAKNDFLQESKRHLDITSLLKTVCYEFIDSGKKVHINEEAPIINFYGAKIALKRCFTNIIENAIKYANEVWVDIEIANQIIITFDDHGPGLNDDQLKLVLKPFYRIQNPTTNVKPGSGLGLTIVNEIIQQHDGNLSLTNQPQGGLLVTVTLPKNSK